MSLFQPLLSRSVIEAPVLFCTSRRALARLSHTNVTTGQQQAQARDALKSAALTYVIAAVGSLVTLLYYINIFLGSRDRN